MIIYTAEVIVHNGMGLETMYLSSHPFVTSGADTPAHTAFECRLVDPVLLKLSAFQNALTSGGSSTGGGEIVVSNPDNYYGYLSNYGFDGRSVVVRVGESGAAYPSGFTTILNGTMLAPKFDRTRFTIRVKDNQEMLNEALLTTTYLGNNVLPNGLEGVAGDIKGQVKPRVYGSVFNIDPVFVNTSKLIYQVSDGAVSDIVAVYDRAVSLTKGADYASEADMLATAPAAGNFRAWPAGGMFRLGSSPAGLITADVVQGASAANRTVAQVLKSIAESMGMTVNTSDVTALDALNNAEIGVYVNSEETALSVMDQVAESIGAWFSTDNLGQLRMGRLEAPSGTPAFVIDDNTYIKVDLISNADTDNGVPLSEWKLNYKKFYTVQDSDIAGSVSDARKGELQNEYRSAVNLDSSVKTKYMLADKYENFTLLIDATAANAEGLRRLNLHKVRRDRVGVRMKVDVESLGLIKMMAVVRLIGNVFDYQKGADFVILGYTLNTKSMFADLVLWGYNGIGSIVDGGNSGTIQTSFIDGGLSNTIQSNLLEGGFS